MKQYGDITKLSGHDLDPVDLIVGGSPCQDLSVAGKRAGLDGERSGLFLEMIRIIRQMRKETNGIYPRFALWENVPGAFSSNNGRDFGTVLGEFARLIEPGSPDVPVPQDGWTKAGILLVSNGQIAWRTHDAQYWGRTIRDSRTGDVLQMGTPQRRRRISLVADLRGQSAAEILFERKGVSGNTEPGGEAGKDPAEGTGDGVENASGLTNRGYYTGNVAETLRAEPHGALPMVTSMKRLNVLNDQGGGQMDVTDGIAMTLRSQSHGHEPTIIEMTSTNNTIVEDGIVPTLTARMGTGGNQVNAVYDIVKRTALSIGNGQTNNISLSDKANALDTMHDQQAVIVPAVDCRNLNEHQEVSGTLQCKQNGGYSLNYQNPIRVQGEVAHTLKGKANCDFREDSETYPVQNNAIRRLTPLECERLQGYPDGWTDIPGAAGSARYKALGNSIALPFWEFLAHRFAQYGKVRTIGSLFDGIGGFPLVFKRAGAETKWTSEIEPFCEKVVKYHLEKGDL